MPSYPCRHPTCTTYLPTRGYCEKHAANAVPDHRHYDHLKRDADAARFYHSAAWRGPHGARAIKLASHPVCERCEKFAEHVHHRIALAECTDEQKTEQKNLMSLCQPCHNALESEIRKGARVG